MVTICDTGQVTIIVILFYDKPSVLLFIMFMEGWEGHSYMHRVVPNIYN